MTSKKEFLCPLPWVSLCIHTDGKQKVCCHTDSPHAIESNTGQEAHLLDEATMNDPLNNRGLIQMREKMLKGEVPQECLKCANLEDSQSNSPRLEALKYYEKEMLHSLKRTTPQGEIDSPQLAFLDLSLGNNCNLACLSCHPYYSTGVEKSWQKGPFQYDKQKYQEIAAFTAGAKKFPKFKGGFRQIFFQGGEPLIEKSHHELLNQLIKEGQSSEIELIYNTNLTVLNNTLFELWNHFKSIKLDVSMDGIEQDQEVLRPPLKWRTFLANIEKIKSRPDITIEFVTVIQALNIFKLDKVINFAQKYSTSGRGPSLNLIENPEHLSLKALKKTDLEAAINLYQPKSDDCSQEILAHLKATTPQPELSFQLYLQIKKLGLDHGWNFHG